MKRGCAALILVLVAAVIAYRCSRGLPRKAAKLLRAADTIEVYSLHPESEGEPRFHGWKVLGKVAVRGPKRKGLAESVIRHMLPHGMMYAACFNPRHGLRASSPQGTVDFVICFECAGVEVYYSKEGATKANTDLDPAWGLSFVLNYYLTEAGIEVLPNPWDKPVPAAPSTGTKP